MLNVRPCTAEKTCTTCHNCCKSTTCIFNSIALLPMMKLSDNWAQFIITAGSSDWLQVTEAMQSRWHFPWWGDEWWFAQHWQVISNGHYDLWYDSMYMATPIFLESLVMRMGCTYVVVVGIAPCPAGWRLSRIECYLTLLLWLHIGENMGCSSHDPFWSMDHGVWSTCTWLSSHKILLQKLLCIKNVFGKKVPWTPYKHVALVSNVNATHCYKASMLSLLSSSAFINELPSKFTLQVSLVCFLSLSH